MGTISISHADTTLFPSVLHRITLLSHSTLSIALFYLSIFPAWIWSRRGVSMVIVAPRFIISKHAIKLMKTYAVVNIWLAFIYVPNPFQLKPHWSLRERLRAVINCLYMHLIKGLNWIHGKHCFLLRKIKPAIFTYLQHWGLMQLKTAHVTQWTSKVFLRHYIAVPVDLSPFFLITGTVVLLEKQI